MEKGFFFNAMPDETFETGYDRNYSADDISNWLQVAFTTGVVKTNSQGGEPQGLKVVADSGMNIKVNAGFACILGKPYINDAQLSLTIGTAPTGANPRYDAIILRMDNTQTKGARKTYIYVKQLGSNPPTISDLTRNDTIYELLIAYVIVNPNVTTITQGYIKDRRGNENYCPWFTAVKGYEDYYDAIVQQFEFNGTMASAGTTITTDIASRLYNDRYSLIEVYCNGLKEENTAYSISTSGSYIVVNFTAQKSAGAKISVILNNFIDGEGLSTALAQYSQWVQIVENLQTAIGEYTYVCNGVNDNVNISNIVKAFYSVDDNSTLKLNIVGTFGMSAPVRGDGTSASPYYWLDVTKQVSTNRVATLDFSNCSQIRIAKTKNNDTDILTGDTSGKYSAFIRGEVVNVIGLNLIFEDTTTDTSFKVFPHQGGRIRVEYCRFWLTAYKSTLIAYVGSFLNCRGSVANTADNSYCFMPQTIVRVESGEYYSYTGDSTKKSAIIGQSTANSVSILYGVNVPIIARSGFYQTNSLLQFSGGGKVCCRDMITTLTDVIASGLVDNTIAINKPNAQ